MKVCDAALAKLVGLPATVPLFSDKPIMGHQLLTPALPLPGHLPW
jgi:hypothetical protein